MTRFSRRLSRSILALVWLGMVSMAAIAQTELPGINVTAPKWEERHGGYIISSNFQVDTHMSAVVFPAEPFQKDDILSIRPTRMKDDEYFVLQECISNDCLQAQILRVFTSHGALGITAHQQDRVWIPHEGKFFMWMQRFPMSGFSSHAFSGYKQFSPPMVLNPIGTAEQFHATDVKAAQEGGPEKVISSDHDGSSFVLRFEGGTVILVQRMHAVE